VKIRKFEKWTSSYDIDLIPVNKKFIEGRGGYKPHLVSRGGGELYTKKKKCRGSPGEATLAAECNIGGNWTCAIFGGEEITLGLGGVEERWLQRGKRVTNCH